MADGGGTGRLRSVDLLRLTAAVLVVLHHSALTSRDVLPLKALSPLAAVGPSGVGLFLVVSGFSIHLRWAARPEARERFSVRIFWLRRFWRLYPPYYAAVVLSLVLYCLALGTQPFLAAPTPWVVAGGNVGGWAQAALTVTVVLGCLVPIKWLGVAWSLALEEHIYAVYAVVLRFTRRLDPWRIVAYALAVSLVWDVGSEVVTTSVPPYQFLHDGSAPLLSRLMYRQFPARGFEWALGLLAAEAFVGRVSLPRLAARWELGAALFVVAGVLFRHPVGAATLHGHPFFVSDLVLDQLFGLAFFVILNALLRVDRVGRLSGSRLCAIGAAAGTASYSLYLLHPAVIALVLPHLPRTGAGRFAGMLVMWLVLAVVTAVFYRLVERPFVRKAGRSGASHNRAGAPADVETPT